MKKIVKHIDAYTFDELDEEAKDRVRGDYQETCRDYWDESVLEYWTSNLEAQGFLDPSIRYSGFWSQGDGASFTASIDVLAYLDAAGLVGKFPTIVGSFSPKSLLEPPILEIIPNQWSTYYCHEKTIGVVIEDNMRYVDEEVSQEQLEAYEKELEQLEAYIENDIVDLSHKIYQNLENEYESMFSDEYILENCQANGYLFDKNGRLI